MEFRVIYDELSKNLPNKDLTKVQKRKLITDIENLDLEKKETLYLLIAEDYVRFEGESKNPYEMKDLGVVGFEFNLEMMPTRLKHILKEFIKYKPRKVKKIVEDDDIEYL